MTDTPSTRSASIVERLRYVAQIKSNLDRDKELIAQAADEIERLRATVVEQQVMTDDLVRDLRAMGYITCVKAADEIERLRAALQEIAQFGGAEDTMACMARRALEPKP